MHRLGFLPEETDKLITSLAELKNLHIKSIFSHLAASDDPAENAFTRKQQSVFLDVYEKLTACLGYRPMRHLLNSAGIERFPEAHFEMVRLGIGLHGISAANKKLLPASTLRTTITQIKYLAKGESVGYNRREILTRDSKIAIIPVGYADGLSRGLGNRNGQIIVNDRKVPIIGDVCMDMFMADITGMDAKEGDTVIVFGQANPVSELAASIGTIPYEVLSNISSRVKRVYINE
jgi:alanine racemase